MKAPSWEEFSRLRQENEQLREQDKRLREQNKQLRDQLAQALQQIEALHNRISELEALLAQATRASRRQAAPFARQKRKPKPKKPGRKKGHPAAHRPKPSHVDKTLSAPQLDNCPHCSDPVTDSKDLENYQTDLPRIEPEITRFQFQSAWCESCGKRVFSLHPEQTSTATGTAAHHMGPRLRAFVADLKSRLGVPFRKIQDILKQSFGIDLSPGAMVLSNHRLAEQSQATLDSLMAELAGEQLVHADETGWRVNAQSAWVVVVCSQRLTVYLISPHRNAAVVSEVLGQSFKGTLMRDGWASYDAQLDYPMLRCLRHLQHNAEDWEKPTEDDESLSVGELFLLWLEGVFCLKKRAQDLNKQAYAEEAEELIQWFDQWIQDPVDSATQQSLLDRLVQLRDQIFPILEDPDLPATNNQAERQIRPIVIHRKISAGNKTPLGAATLCSLASLAASCCQQAVNFAEVIGKILRGPADLPVEFWRFNDTDPSPT